VPHSEQVSNEPTSCQRRMLFKYGFTLQIPTCKLHLPSIQGNWGFSDYEILPMNNCSLLGDMPFRSRGDTPHKMRGLGVEKFMVQLNVTRLDSSSDKSSDLVKLIYSAFTNPQVTLCSHWDYMLTLSSPGAFPGAEGKEQKPKEKSSSGKEKESKMEKKSTIGKRKGSSIALCVPRNALNPACLKRPPQPMS
jgi:hypothetical protein